MVLRKTTVSRLNIIYKIIVILIIAVLGYFGYQQLTTSEYFKIEKIDIRGELEKQNVQQLQIVKEDILGENLLVVNIAEIKELFERLDWIRTAQIKRDFPNKLIVNLEEHKPIADYNSQDNNSFVNSYGEIFNIEDSKVKFAKLPLFIANEKDIGTLISLYQNVNKIFAATGSAIQQIKFDETGNWSFILANQLQINAGYGSIKQVTHRVVKFLFGLQQLIAKKQLTTELDYVDLRYPDGFAIKLKQQIEVQTNKAKG